MGLRVIDLDRIADRVDIRVVRLIIFVHMDRTGLTDLEPGRSRELRLGEDADGQNDRVGRIGLLRAVPLDRHALLRDRLHVRVQQELNAVVVQLLVQDLDHILVKRLQDLTGQLRQRDVLPGQLQIFRSLNTNKAAADHEDTLRLGLIQKCLERDDVADIADGEHILTVRALQGRRNDGVCARRQDELVIGLLIRLAGLRAAHGDGLLLAVDGHDLGMHTHIDVMLLPEGRRGHHDEVLAVLHRAAQIIRKAAVGKRHVAALFKHHDVRIFVQALDARRSRCAAGHTADDNDPEFFILCCHRFLPLISPASCRRRQGSSSRWHRKLPRSRGRPRHLRFPPACPDGPSAQA